MENAVGGAAGVADPAVADRLTPAGGKIVRLAFVSSTVALFAVGVVASTAQATIYTNTNVELKPVASFGSNYAATIWQSPGREISTNTDARFFFDPVTSRFKGIDTSLDEGSDWWVVTFNGLTLTKRQIIDSPSPVGNGVVLADFAAIGLYFTSVTGNNVPPGDPNYGQISGWIALGLEQDPSTNAYRLLIGDNAVAYGQPPIEVGQTPEPATLLTAVGGAALGLHRRRRPAC